MTYVAESLRQLIAERAIERCEYCRLHNRDAYHQHEIDHIYAEKHGGMTDANNLCLACADCNRYKGSDICSLDPLTGEIHPLFHPRQHQWTEHFYLEPLGLIEPLTAAGRVTERILRFNRPEMVSDRFRLLRVGGYEDI